MKAARTLRAVRLQAFSLLLKLRVCWFVSEDRHNSRFYWFFVAFCRQMFKVWWFEHLFWTRREADFLCRRSRRTHWLVSCFAHVFFLTTVGPIMSHCRDGTSSRFLRFHAAKDKYQRIRR